MGPTGKESRIMVVWTTQLVVNYTVACFNQVKHALCQISARMETAPAHNASKFCMVHAMLLLYAVPKCPVILVNVWSIIKAFAQ